MKIIKEAQDFLDTKMNNLTTSDRVQLSRDGKRLVLAINEIYKETKDPTLMDLMKELTVKKKRIDVRLKGRPSG